MVKGDEGGEDYPSPLEMPINTRNSDRKVKGEGFLQDCSYTKLLDFKPLF